MSEHSGARRRAAVAAALEGAAGPVSATELARRFSVSRQIIVGDVALLRAEGADITATPRGYLLGRRSAGIERRVACIHGPEDMERELNAIVDAGGEAVDVVVEHPVYGQLTGRLDLSSRHDVAEFTRRVADSRSQPLAALTDGIHLHTLSCPDEAAWQRVRQALEQAGFLLT